MNSEPMTTSVFSVDVEDWFHILNLPSGQGMQGWDALPSRVETNFRKLLDLFSRHNVRVSCFFLGWVAEKYPHLVREAAERGHEIASHGYSHSLVFNMSSEQFLDDIRRSREILESISGRPVIGYRAPGYSVTERSPWFFEKVAEAGYQYDSSVFPTTRGHGGVSGTQCAPYTIPVGSSETLIEFPISVAEILTVRLCLFGGGYLRLFPWWLIKPMAHRVNRQGRPVTFYVHPREIDPDHPRIPMNPLRRFKCYTNLKTTESKLERILSEFPVTTFQQFLTEHGSKFTAGAETPHIMVTATHHGN
ncbi:MAG TPA: XrtA system polysaccharide deacetylase [Bryobacteraceae bacterium]|nr:XrtA system polysaccharide deacetylase [Bryobacteraceae bacterium]